MRCFSVDANLYMGKPCESAGRPLADRLLRYRQDKYFSSPRMPGLDELVVSLTKNGFFKIARVILDFPRNEVLDHIAGPEPYPVLDTAQVVNILSGNPQTNELPELWDRVRPLGEPAVHALVLIAILYSHHTLINAFRECSQGEMRGVLTRDAIGNDKIYTNIAYTLAQAQVSEQPTRGAQNHPYNLQPLFAIPAVGPLAKELIDLKLRRTGWSPPTENDYFKRTFYEQCDYYRFPQVLGTSRKQFEDWLEGRQVEIEVPPPVNIPTEEVTVSASLLAALATKPFVVLCGTTGTGKTQTIRRLASAVLPTDVPPSFNHAFIPVEAGWTDGRHLVGYRNPFGPNGETYVLSPLVELALRANYSGYATVPFFIILDEMNLSYVELYFSRFLSLMETARDAQPEPLLKREELQLIRDTAVVTATTYAYLDEAINRGGLFLTPNIFIVGTVNVDETTHMFSPKVLDRAFVLEFGTVVPSASASAYELPAEDHCTGTADAISNALTGNRIAPNQTIDPFLDQVYDALGKFRFGYRVVQEARRFVSTTTGIRNTFACHQEYGSESSIKDALLCQKLLPKLHGNRGQIGSIVQNVKALADTQGCIKASAKLEAMSEDVQLIGFTNFFSSL